MRREFGNLIRISITMSLQSPTQPIQKELFSKPLSQALFIPDITTLYVAYIQSPFPLALIQHTNLVDSIVEALVNQGEKKCTI